jgi:hypothetical protein
MNLSAADYRQEGTAVQWDFGSRAAVASGALCAFALAPGTNAGTEGEGDDGRLKAKFTQEISIGFTSRVGRRDAGLIGGGNGGTGTSVNFDDGNLNYGRGLASLAVQGRSTVTGESEHVEGGLEAVYFYDFLNASNETDFRPLSDAARDRAGRDFYLNDAFLGLKRDFHDVRLRVRAGNQRLRWSDSASFGQSIAPVNPVAASRRYQPGNTAKDMVVAVPMLFADLVTEENWTLSGFYQFGFKPTEPEAAGTFLSANDYYSPGARFLQLGQGSPLVPDQDASVTTPATPFGSRVPRGADRLPRSSGQFGLRVETPESGAAKIVTAGYAMRLHAREPIVSVHSGTLDGLLGVTVQDYTSSGRYFLEYPEGVTVVGGSLRANPAVHTLVSLNYSMRIRQPLQIDDIILITAGLAPAAATGACTANPASALCIGTLAALNANPMIAARGGITAANAGSFFDTELPGFERFDVSQWAVSAVQGLPPVLGTTRWYASAEVGGIYIHGFKPGFLDASVSVRSNENGTARNGLASRSAWGYRLFTKMSLADVAGLRSVAPSLTWIHDVQGNAPITLGTLLEGTRSYIVAVDVDIEKTVSARIAYRAWLGRGSAADRYTDRDYVSFFLTKKF